MKTGILLTCGLMALAAGASALELVKAGKPQGEIIIAEDAHKGVRLAAEELQYHIEKISGAKLEIVNAPTDRYPNRLYVGESQFTEKLGYVAPSFKNSGSGYDIAICGSNAILNGKMNIGKPFPYSINAADLLWIRFGKNEPANFPSPETKKWLDYIGDSQYFEIADINGLFNKPLGIFVNDDIGPWHAVTAVLEKLGVRFYAPYEDGTIIPSMKDISLPEGRWTSEAAFAYRDFFCYRVNQTDEGLRWLKRLGGGKAFRDIFAHSSIYIFSSAIQKKNHPEYLACKEPGLFYPGYPVGSCYPRFGHQGFRDACVLYARKMLDAAPDLKAISIGAPDGPVEIDYRDLPEYIKRWKTDNITQIKANLLWDFSVFIAGELKKSHPDRIYYHWTHYNRLMPTNFSPDDPDNIAVPLINSPSGPEQVIETGFQQNLDFQLQWAKQSNGHKVPCWEYFLYSGMRGKPVFPVFFTKTLQRQMKAMLPYSCGKFIEVTYDKANPPKESRWSVPTMHLMMYLQMKLFWDPDLDLKTLLDEYYQLYFGPAAAEMKEFHEFAEEAWSRQDSRSITATTGWLKEKDVNTYFEILGRALKKVEPDCVYARRIQALIKDIEPLEKLFDGLKRTGPPIILTKIAGQVDMDAGPRGVFSKFRMLRDNHTGEPVNLNGTEVNVGISTDRQYLYVGVICHDMDMKSLKASCTANDAEEIWKDDVIEMFFDSPLRSFFHIVVNAQGAVWDRSTDQTIVSRETLPILWTPGVKTSVKRFDDRWELLARIPTEDFGDLGPRPSAPWGVGVFRVRQSAPSKNQALSPTGGKFFIPSKWCSAWMR